MKPYWKPQHEVFIRCMLKHEDPTKAYRTAYPKAKPASARVGGIRLSGYPHIRQRIEPVIKERRIKVHRLALEEGAERERKENERRDEIRRVLYKVVMKQLRKQRVFVIKGKTITFEDDPPTNTILNAMVLDLRLEAGYNNWPVIERRFARIMASLLPREKWVHPVTNSEANPTQATNSPFEGGCQRVALTGGCRVTRDSENTLMAQTSPFAPFKEGTRIFREQSVTEARAKPAHTIPAAIHPATIGTPIVTKAIYVQVYPPPDIGFSSKSV